MKRILAVLFAVTLIGSIVSGCGKKDETTDKAPPVGDGARADAPNPDKVKNLPPPVQPVGGGK